MNILKLKLRVLCKWFFWFTPILLSIGLMVAEKSFGDVPMACVEKFWDKKPCNIDYASGLLSKSFFDKIERFRYRTEKHIPCFAEFDHWKGKNVLEIGCGIGTEAINFARAGAYVTAIDLSGKSIEITKKRFEIYGLNARLIHGNAEELDNYIKGERFDLIWSHGVIHHSPHPERIIHQCKNFLKPNGELRIMLYAKVSANIIQWMIDRQIFDLNYANELAAAQGESQSNSPVTYTYTFSSIRKLLHGFNIISMKKVCIGHPKFLVKLSKEDLTEVEEELGWFILVQAAL